MKLSARAVLIVLLIACLGAPVRAAEQAASEATIKEILEVTDVRKLVDGMVPQLGAMMKQGMEQATAGMSLTAEDRELMDRMVSRMMEAFREQMSWSKLEPMYVRIYRKTFTQEELEGMLAFYRTPFGAAMIKKMPAVMQESMRESQEMMGPMMQRMQESVQEIVAELESRKKKAVETK